MQVVFWSGEPVNVTNLAKDHPAIEVTDVGNSHDDRIVKTHALCHFSLHSGNLLIQKFNLSNYGSDLDGQVSGWIARPTFVPELLILPPVPF